MWIVVETIEQGDKKCMAVPESWIADGILSYPKMTSLNKYRKKESKPKDDWNKMECKMISEKFGIYSIKSYLCKPYI